MSHSSRNPEQSANFIAEVVNANLPQDLRNEIRTEHLRVLERQSKHQKNNRSVLLVGGAGYVGSIITGQLLDAGYNVRCLDLLLYQNDVCVLPYLRHENYDFIHGDHCDPNAIASALQGATDVVILSGLVGDPITKKYPNESHAINLAGMQSMIRSLNGYGLSRVVFVSTCSNYGLIPDDQTADETFELKPLSLYAEAKVANEKFLIDQKNYVDYHGSVLRFSTAFGLSPRMRFDLTVNEFVRDLFLDKELLVYDAHTWRPYCHTKDFAQAIRRVLELSPQRSSFEVFNVGGDSNNCTKQMIVDKITHYLPKAKISYKEHGSDPRNYRVNFNKINDRLVFTPQFSVDDGIQEILQALEQKLFDRVDQCRPFYGNYELTYNR